MLNSENHIVKYMATRRLTYTVIGHNIRVISGEMKVPLRELLTQTNPDFSQMLKCNNDDLCTVQLITDLCNNELGPDLIQDITNEILDYFCTKIPSIWAKFDNYCG